MNLASLKFLLLADRGRRRGTKVKLRTTSVVCFGGIDVPSNSEANNVTTSIYFLPDIIENRNRDLHIESLNIPAHTFPVSSVNHRQPELA